MEYRAIFKQYSGSVPVKTEYIRLDKNKTEQWKNLEQFPCRIQCIKKTEGTEQVFLLRAEMLAHMDVPVSLALEFVPENWKGGEYVFVPGAVYDGNKMESKRLSYPPYHAAHTDAGWEPVITDIPHLDKKGNDSCIQFRSGDMSTPAMGYYDDSRKEGILILSKHRINSRYTGFTLTGEKGTVFFRVSCPAVREEKKYFFGELPDGSGFFPSSDYLSDDEGMILKNGERLEMEIRVCCFFCENLNGYLARCNEVREILEEGKEFYTIPFSRAYHAVKEKYEKMNFTDEGYYRVGTENTAPPSYWQAGWVGGGMNTLPFLLEDQGKARSQAVCTLDFIIRKLQRENGWYIPMYACGQNYGDDFLSKDSPVLLVRKDADLLYFLLKQAFYLKIQGKLTEGLEESIRRQADAFVRFFKKNGQLGQFIHMEEETLIGGDTASAAITPGALALAYEYFQNMEYLETAEAMGDWYRENHLKKGIMNGGPGEICQAPDSESAFGFLEACVQLYETTGKDKWLEAARDAFELAITWVMSYDFGFPVRSTAARLGVHTRGTVFANAQNKHSAPGICTLSGNSMLKLYRFTGDKKYLKWMGRISHALSQFVSLPDRPVAALSGRSLPAGYFNERVQTSDWEGKETIGEFLDGSNWPEVTMLLTYVEIPGVYLDLNTGVCQCSDHVKAEVKKREGSRIFLKLDNPTPYDAEVTLLVDHSQDGRALGACYFDRMERVKIEAGGEQEIWIKDQEETDR